jgi:predicted ATPase
VLLDIPVVAVVLVSAVIPVGMMFGAPFPRRIQPTEPDRFHIGRQEIYLYCPGGYGKTKLSNTAFEKAPSVRATTRNWKTVNALFEMASKLDGNS